MANEGDTRMLAFGLPPRARISAGKERWGACIAGDSLVYTPDGARKLTELNVGDYVYSFDDYTLAERKCIGVMDRGMKPVLEVTLEDGRSILATDDQLLVRVPDPRVKTKWWPAFYLWEPLREFKAGHSIIAAKESPETIVQTPLIDDEVAQFLGYRNRAVAEYAINPFFDETYIALLDIKSIQPAGEVEVYELAIELEASFVANGFVLLQCPSLL